MTAQQISTLSDNELKALLFHVQSEIASSERTEIPKPRREFLMMPAMIARIKIQGIEEIEGTGFLYSK